MGRTKAVVFDVGGTLIYPVDSIGDTYAKVAKRYGCNLNADAINEAFPNARASCKKLPVPSDGNDRVRWKEIVRKSIPDSTFADEKKFTSYFNELYDLYAQPKMWGVYPEVVEVLEDLQDRELDLVVLSNWDDRLDGILDGLGIGDFFTQRFISTKVGWEKPDPAIFRHVADVLRLDATKVLAVGDDPKCDGEGAKKAGWKSVVIERPRHDLWYVVKMLNKR